MGRKSSLGKMVFKAAKTAIREAEKAQRAAEKEMKRREREAAKLQREEEKKREKERKALEKEQRLKQKAKDKKAKEHDLFILNNLTLETIKRYNLGNIEETKTSIDINTDLKYEIQLVNTLNDGEYFADDKKIKVADIDQFLLSGRFNSVLGPEGFKLFKDEIKKIIESVNKKTNKDNFINLDKLFEILLHSGLYYEYQYLPENMQYLDDDQGWLTAYRFISKNFKGIKYEELRSIVKDLNKTDGNTLEFDSSDIKSKLYQKVTTSGLFEESSSAESILASLSLTDIRSICKENNISSKRSKEETIAEVLKNEIVCRNIENDFNNKNALIFTLKDYDLVSGKSIIHLDKYLRDVAKNIRSELFDFVELKQSYKLVG